MSVLAGRGLALRGAAIFLAAAAPAARADVIEIGDDGSVAVRASDWGDPRTIDAGAAAEALDGRVADIGSPEPGPDVPSAALTTLDAPLVPLVYQTPFARAAASARVSPNLLAALVWQESRWRTGALSPKGARGLTQLMPGTARALAVNPADAGANLAGGARYLRTLLDQFDGNVEHALAAYNAGPGRVLRARGIPAITETRAYVASIIDRLGDNGAMPQGRRP